jgi:anti-sigma regulatory factor (Ser/Thr protein kinase)
MIQDLNIPDLSSAALVDHYHLRIPSKPEWIAPTIDYLMDRAARCGAVQPSRAMKVRLALNEALTNSIIHGNLGISSKLKEESDSAFARAVAARCSDPSYAMRPVDIHVSYDGQRIRWVMTDQGEGFDVGAVLARLDEGSMDPLRPSGRGLMMMRAFLDELHYEEQGRRAILVLHRSSGSEKRKQPRWPSTAASAWRPSTNRAASTAKTAAMSWAAT